MKISALISLDSISSHGGAESLASMCKRDRTILCDFMRKLRHRLNDMDNKFTKYSIWNVNQVDSNYIEISIDVYNIDKSVKKLIDKVNSIKENAVEFACIPQRYRYYPYRDSKRVSIN